jgi:Fur family ferric uptake transcriptional regulator
MRSEIEIFREYIKKKSLRNTAERETIIREIFSRHDHFDIDEIHLRLKKKGRRISRASIYRTIPLLIDSGLVQMVSFEDGHQHYEHIHGHQHHCHLWCLGCGKIIEFQDGRVKKIENELARLHNFRITSHKLKVYGYCEKCRGDKRRNTGEEIPDAEEPLK